MHEEASGPVRTCVGCRRRAPARDLVRVRRADDGTLALGAGDGRGAWLCCPPAGLACLDDAAKRAALGRALRAEISGAEVIALRARLDGRSDARRRRIGPRDRNTHDDTTNTTTRTGRATRGDEEDQDLRAGS